MTRKIFISAGDISGDIHAAGLISRCTAEKDDTEWYGLGGSNMNAAGCRLLIDPESDPVIGFRRVLGKIPYYFRLLARIHKTFVESPPDLVVLVDYPGLNTQIARLAKMRGIRVLYFICPQYWAWAPWRINRFARLVDKALVIFPFEEIYFSSHGVDTTYVGHPVFDRAGSGKKQSAPRPTLASGKLLALLPGSRKHEVESNLPVMLRAAAELLREETDFVPVLAHQRPDCIALAKRLATRSNVNLQTTDADIVDTARASQLCVVASGTATLEVALSGTPFVVVYRISTLARRLARVLLTVPWFCQVNLIAGESLVPEFLLSDDDPSPVLPICRDLLGTTEARETAMARLDKFKEMHYKPGALDRAAQALRSFAHGSSCTHGSS